MVILVKISKNLVDVQDAKTGQVIGGATYTDKGKCIEASVIHSSPGLVERTIQSLEEYFLEK